MEKNASMMIAATYFWSDTFNAFMFGHGPAAPSLADVYMLWAWTSQLPMTVGFSTESPITK
jgi:hypothetical protein